MGSNPVTATREDANRNVHKVEKVFNNFLLKHKIKGRVIIGYSGGIDSLTLLYLAFKNPALDPIAVHIDHRFYQGSGLRALKAREIAIKIGVNISVITVLHPVKDEAKAREIRYHLLRKIKEQEKANAILVAHNANDQVETVLLRIYFGSGIRGLGGIKEKYREIYRPLLSVYRQDILDYIKPIKRNLQIEAIVDPSNKDIRIKRNFFRNLLIPYLQKEYNFDPTTIINISKISKGAQNKIDKIVENFICLSDLSLPAVKIKTLFTLDKELRYYTLSYLALRSGLKLPPSRRSIDEIMRQLNLGKVTTRINNGWLAVEWKGFLMFIPEIEKFDIKIGIGESVTIPFSGDKISIISSNSKGVNGLPYPKSGFFIVRNRRTGDKIKLRGHRRKLKDIFINLKIPRFLRQFVPLITDSEGNILWIGAGIGYSDIAKDCKYKPLSAKIEIGTINWRGVLCK